MIQKEKEFRERCALRGLEAADIERAVDWVRRLVEEAAGYDGGLSSASPETFKRFASLDAGAGADAPDRLLAYARYCAVIGREDLVVWLSSLLLPIGVLPAVSERLAALEGEELRDLVFRGVEIPPSGAFPEAYPAPTALVVSRLEAALPPERAYRVLCQNVHRVPDAAFAAEKEAFGKAATIDEWLQAWHARQVAALERHAADGTLWYEQRITQAVVEFVRANPEVLGGRREGNRVYITKIPYDPDRWLASTDPLERRRLACHCPLAASSITSGGAGVSPAWCACSAGYEKRILDVVFGLAESGGETESEVLESVLGGAGRCRFAVVIPPAVLAAKRAGYA
ncbi:MAG: hypothetical protein JNG85_01095 [Spirochaetaceae bacterium]|nr:hypothetical protein [Spirochaetaceae bacterium]